jgi:CheY-like chemotaxis protein
VEILLIDADTLDEDPDDLSSLLEYAAPGTRVVSLERLARLERSENADDTLLLPAALALVKRTLVRALVLGAPSDPIDKVRERVRGRRVLIVEDNVVNERLLAATLVKEGLKVLTAHTGLEAVERLERESVDLVLMDVQMPVLDGLEATRRIRRMPRHRRLPIVALTAQARIEDHENCLAAGMNDYLAKPASRDELISTVFRWLTDEGVNENSLDEEFEETSTW